MNDTGDLCVNNTGNVAANPAVHTDIAGALLNEVAVLEREGGLFDDDVAEQQDLRKHEHYQEDGDEGTASEADTNGGDRHIRGKESDEQTRDSEYRTGGDDRRECLVQRFYHSVLGGHALLEVGVAAGNNDRVVDVGTHLNGAYDKVAQEEDVSVHQHRHGEVYPYCALDYREQQNGKSRGLEREHQDNKYEQERQNAYHQVIGGEYVRQVVVRRGVADNVGILGIVLLDYLVQLVEELECFGAFFGNVGVQQHTAVFVGAELELRLVELLVEVVNLIVQLVVEVDVACFLLIIDEREHVDERHGERAYG